MFTGHWPCEWNGKIWPKIQQFMDLIAISLQEITQTTELSSSSCMWNPGLFSIVKVLKGGSLFTQ